MRYRAWPLHHLTAGPRRPAPGRCITGFDTTTNLLGNGLQLILRDAGLAAALREGSVPIVRPGLVLRGFGTLPITVA